MIETIGIIVRSVATGKCSATIETATVEEVTTIEEVITMKNDRVFV